MSNEENISLPKDVCVLNTLAMGIAIQIIAQTTGESIEAWKNHIGVIANEQYRQLSAERMQEIVNELKSF
ncbi:hypothetical protein [Nostoc sp.]|uniref:hypothetical protein n=1 Tax=Nostoc sp. TaxID=1180 RepID=UPI002FF8AAD0